MNFLDLKGLNEYLAVKWCSRGMEGKEGYKQRGK